VLLDKVNEPTEREWYARGTVEHGWSRNVLAHQIEGGLYRRQGQAVTNFERTLPAPQSDLARELIKDPYHFNSMRRLRTSPIAAAPGVRPPGMGAATVGSPA
jgi:predicted nuclease of restriction endonuclease-like (RecB) superfamily